MKINFDITVNKCHPEDIEDLDEYLDDLKNDMRDRFPEFSGFDILDISVTEEM